MSYVENLFIFLFLLIQFFLSSIFGLKNKNLKSIKSNQMLNWGVAFDIICQRAKFNFTKRNYLLNRFKNQLNLLFRI